MELLHLENAWQVDMAIQSEEKRVVLIRFGKDYDKECMKIDNILRKVAEKVKLFCCIYLVDIDEIDDFNDMYELYDPWCIMFFFRNHHIKVDSGTGDNNKVNFQVDKTELIDIIELVYRGARKGKGLVTNVYSHSGTQKF